MVKKIIQTHHNICTTFLTRQSLSEAKNTNSTSAFAQHSMVNQRFNVILNLVKEAISDRVVVDCSPVRLWMVNINIETFLIYMKCNI